GSPASAQPALNASRGTGRRAAPPSAPARRPARRPPGHWRARLLSRSRGVGNAQRGQHRAQVPVRLGQLRAGNRISDDATAREQRRFAATQQRRANANDELTLTCSIQPADRTAVPAAVEVFSFTDQRQRWLPRHAANYGGGMQALNDLEDAASGRQLAVHGREQVLQVGKLAQARLGIGNDAARDFSKSGAQRLNDEVVLRALLRIAQQRSTKRQVFGI